MIIQGSKWQDDVLKKEEKKAVNSRDHWYTGKENDRYEKKKKDREKVRERKRDKGGGWERLV